MPGCFAFSIGLSLFFLLQQATRPGLRLRLRCLSRICEERGAGNRNINPPPKPRPDKGDPGDPESRLKQSAPSRRLRRRGGVWYHGNVFTAMALRGTLPRVQLRSRLAWKSHGMNVRFQNREPLEGIEILPNGGDSSWQSWQRASPVSKVGSEPVSWRVCASCIILRIKAAIFLRLGQVIAGQSPSEAMRPIQRA